MSPGQIEKPLFPSNSSQWSKRAPGKPSNQIKLNTEIQGNSKDDSAKKIFTEVSTPLSLEDTTDSNVPAKATFSFDGENTLTISEDTKININHHVHNSGKGIKEAKKNMKLLTMNDDPTTDISTDFQKPLDTVINVSSGWARFKGAKEEGTGSSFKVVTPSATAGAKETEFLAIVDPQGKTTFLVLEGQIAAFANQSGRDKGKLSLISEGEAQDFFPDGSQSQVRQLLKDF